MDGYLTNIIFSVLVINSLRQWDIDASVNNPTLVWIMSPVWHQAMFSLNATYFIYQTLGKKFQWNYSQENAFEKFVSKMATIGLDLTVLNTAICEMLISLHAMEFYWCFLGPIGMCILDSYLSPYSVVMLCGELLLEYQLYTNHQWMCPECT